MKQAILEHQKNVIINNLDRLDDEEIKSTEAKNAILVLADLGHEYRRPDEVKRCLTHGILTLAAWAMMMMCVAMYFGG